MYWRKDDLKFQVHMKENQLLKYLNFGSAHTLACFKSIPSGVLRRLALLTSITPETENKRMDELYPHHITALRKAKLIKKDFKFLTLKEQFALIQNSKPKPKEELSEEEIAKQNKDKRDKSRTTWFCIGYSRIWGLPIHKRLERLRKKHGLTFLRNRMSYSRFTNLGEKLNADVNNKVMKGVFDFKNKDSKCNCTAVYSIKDKYGKKACLWDGKCRIATVVYELICKKTGKSYIGKTTQWLKDRTMQHVRDVWKVINAGTKEHGKNWKGNGGFTGADSFAKHFAHLCRQCTDQDEVREEMKKLLEIKILWKGERIQCMKSTRTMKCKLCMKERRIILDRFDEDKKKIINDRSDIYSFCKCKSEFHEFFRTISTTSGTEDASNAEKSQCIRMNKNARRKRFSFSTIPLQTPTKTPTSPDGSASSTTTVEPASPSKVAPVFYPQPYMTPTVQDSHIGSQQRIRRTLS